MSSLPDAPHPGRFETKKQPRPGVGFTRGRVAKGGTEPDASVQAGPGPPYFRGSSKDTRRQPPPCYSLKSPLS